MEKVTPTRALAAMSTLQMPQCSLKKNKKNALGSVLYTVDTVDTVDTVETVETVKTETVENVETLYWGETVETESRYQSILVSMICHFSEINDFRGTFDYVIFPDIFLSPT